MKQAYMKIYGFYDIKQINVYIFFRVESLFKMHSGLLRTFIVFSKIRTFLDSLD